ncbi:MAG: PfaB family protein [Gammaproteobacteria bacterium]
MTVQQDIAVVGMGCMFPGAANTDQFWSLIRSADSTAGQPPDKRWPDDPRAFCRDQLTADRIQSSQGCFVDPVPLFTASVSPGLDTTGLDPLFHLLLHAGHQAWNDAATDNVDRSRCGVILGQIVLPSESLSNWSDDLLARATQAAWGETPTASADFNPLNRYVAGLPAGLLAASLDLGGGASCLDAACASSLYAVKLGVDELLEGRRDAMLVGGLSRPDSLYTQMGFSHLHALSPSGRCRPFDRNADGLLVGEGAGMVVLKRLDDALRDGDRIYATLPGIGLSNDIGGNLMHPDSEGQLRAMREAYTAAGWQPEGVDLIECHGTGTPTGDRVELSSLRQLWSSAADGDSAKCVIGSVKSNIGHLLTAAGIAGLIKVLLAIQARQLPPTANVDQPLDELLSQDSQFRILNQAEPWPVRGDAMPRRAAVSAFGFGGINAHVLVQEWTAECADALSSSPRGTSHQQPGEKVGSDPIADDPIAIVGLSGQFGSWTDPATLTARALGVSVADVEPGSGRVLDNDDTSAGYPLDGVRIDGLRFRIPPRELAQLLPQQALMLQTAADALDDANVATDHDAHLSSGVYIGIELDMNTCNFHWRWQLEQRLRDGSLHNGSTAPPDPGVLGELREAATPYLNADRTMGALGGIVASRIARWLGAGAGSFTVSCEQSSALKALEVAIRALRRREINLAVVGGVDLNAEPRALRAQQQLQGDAVFGEGAGAVVLKRRSDAIRDGDRIYCLLRGVSQRSGGQRVNHRGRGVDDSQSAMDEHYRRCLDEALADAGMKAMRAGLVEFDGVNARSPDAMQSLATNVRRRSPDADLMAAPAVVSSSDQVFGDVAAASGMAGLLRLALCLHYRTLPPSSAAMPGGSQQAQYWLRNREEGPRQALLCVDTLLGGSTQIIAEGVDVGADSGARAPLARIPFEAPAVVLCVRGENIDALLAAIDECRWFVSQNVQHNVSALADQWHQRNDQAANAVTVSLVATDAQHIFSLLDEASSCVANRTAAAGNGLFYEPQPLAGEAGRLAFVFPGSGNHYRGMGRRLGLMASAVLEHNDSSNGFLLDQFAGGAFWRDAPVDDHDHTRLLCAQISSSTFAHDIFRHLGVAGDAMIGYSLGETASLFASGCWPDRDEMLARIRDTDLFTRHLGSGFAALREHQGLDDADPVDWRMAMIQAPVEAVRDALTGAFADELIYLLIVNTPNECVIGGDGATLNRLASELGVVLHPINGVTTVHCEVMQPVADAYRALHLQRTCSIEGVSHYSCHLGRRYEVNSESAADSILGMAMEAFDFNALIETAYADGVRLFVETGPGDACTRMIDVILGERPHLACSVSHSRGDEVSHFLHALARIAAHGVAVDVANWTQHCAVPDTRQARREELMLAPGLSVWQVPSRPVTTVDSAVLAPAVVDTHDLSPLPMNVSAAVFAPALAANEQWPATVVDGMLSMLDSRHQAHQAFLDLQHSIDNSLGEAMQLCLSAGTVPMSRPAADPLTVDAMGGHDSGAVAEKAFSGASPQSQVGVSPAIAFTREQCLQFAVGGLADVFGADFADIDHHPTRVRLPDEPLMLVDRIMSIEGQAGTLGPARIVTEHDIHPGAWYLDGDRIPTCIAVEAGQADLFLSAWLGIDRVTRGEAVYRLLDATISFHDELPGAGECIRYDIRINRFFTLGATHLFQFEFDATVEGRPLLTMRNGSAGFFSAAELAAGQGIVDPKLARATADTRSNEHSAWFAPPLQTGEHYNDAQLDALRNGDTGACFGADFDVLALHRAETLPGDRMRLVHRVLEIRAADGDQPGLIIGEADIHADDWFLTCHFVDDQVMPGTLMYECCLHTLRIYLLRMGWVGEQGQVAYQSVPGYDGKLKCRGQVIAATRTVQYRITVVKTAYMDDGTPYAVADALMLADGHPIVEMQNMSLCLRGIQREQIEALWRPGAVAPAQTTALFDRASILAYAQGRPSEGFGDRYRVFDGDGLGNGNSDRVLARLPRPPYLFMDEVDCIDGCEPWQLSAGGEIESTHLITPADWYFESNRQHSVPLAMLMEIALQPCGWLAAYLGSALTSESDLSFRNLDGHATLHRPMDSLSGRLRAKTRINKVSSSGGMIIQSFSVSLHDAVGLLYQCETVFGFFSKSALAQQIGVREAQWYAVENMIPNPDGQQPFPAQAPFPDAQMRMLDQLSVLSLTGGRHGLGWVEGHADVDRSAWYFEAHFYQDPVIPGSLGIESMAQLLKVYALERWSHLKNHDDPGAQFQCPACAVEMKWTYRGQVVPDNGRVSVQIHIARVDTATSTLIADGYLSVDGRIIYSVENLSLSMRGGE